MISNQQLAGPRWKALDRL